MTETSAHPTPATLRRLSTLRELPQDELQDLSDRLHIHEAGKGSVLLQLGATDEHTLYLIEGSCRLVADDGGVKIINHTDASALAPLARLRPSHYKVIAESAVRYLRIDSDVIDQAVAAADQPSSLSLETYQVEEEDDLGHMAAENRLTLHIYEDLNAERLLLPTLPDVAIRIGEAVNDENSDARKVGAVIETDPAIALKVLKAANSARFGGISQIATVTEAVARLGMQNTRFLVVTFALRELFRTNSRQLEKRMHDLWEHSRRIAALSQVLGDKVGKFNSHEALLAGLVHDGFALAVCSNGSHEYINAVLESTGISDHFVLLESGYHDSSKSVAMARLRRESGFGNIILIGDTPQDRQAAADNCLPFIAAMYGYGAAKLADCELSADGAADIGLLLRRWQASS